ERIVHAIQPVKGGGNRGTCSPQARKKVCRYPWHQSCPVRAPDFYGRGLCATISPMATTHGPRLRWWRRNHPGIYHLHSETGITECANPFRNLSHCYELPILCAERECLYGCWS